MTAKNHRGNIIVSTGFLNEKRNAEEAIAQEMARRGFSGENWNPDTALYDEAFGPQDMSHRRAPDNAMAISDYDLHNTMSSIERNVEGEN